jgi:hypothetical protein
MFELAWNYVDLEVTTLLSFERPLLRRFALMLARRRAP